MKSRYVALCIVFVFICSQVGCFSTTKGDLSISEWRMEMFDSTLRSESKQADSLLDHIVNAVEANDSTSLYSIFSVHTSGSVDDLEVQIRDFFDHFEGKMISKKRYGPASYSTREGNSVVKEIEASYDIITTDSTYRVAIKFCVIDSENPDNVGLISIYFTEAICSNMNYAYWGDGNWNPGITIDTSSQM